MSESTRPRRVVMVDAENPLREIAGEFFWREDHERIVTDERGAAYWDGYEQGFAAATRPRPFTLYARATRRLPRRRWAMRCLTLLIVAAFVVEVLLPALGRLV